MNGQVAAYGLALNMGAPTPAAAVAPAAVSSAPPAGGFNLGDAFYVNRWESSAVGALLLVGLALVANAYFDA